MSLHIALCGPASIDMLTSRLEPSTRPALQHVGYPFPLLPTLAASFLDKGHRVSIVTTSNDAETITPYIGTQLSVVVVPSRVRARDRAFDMFAVERRGVSEALRLLKPDVTHAHWTYEFALGALADGQSPAVVTAHDAPLTVLRHMPDAYRAVRAAMAYRTRWRVSDLTAVSPYLAARWRREMFYRAGIDVIPNPLPVGSELTAPARPSFDSPVILSVADSSRRKNVSTLLRAFALVKRRHPRAELRLVGDGLGSEDELARAWLADGPSSGVVFLGRLTRNELVTEYSRATVFCHTSLEESQGLVLLEALQSGLPIVAGQNSGAVSWTLFEGEAGLLTDVRSPSAVAGALEDVIDDPARARAADFGGAQRIRERFGTEAIADLYIARYERSIDSAIG